jgi:uncharacterized protein YbjQ (UPF0145 family)
MNITTSATIAGKRITRTLGLVRGNTIRARHIGRDITAALRNLVGGEVSEYTKLMAEAREQALDRMVEEARELDADAIVDVRFQTSMVVTGAAELLAYGTAVKIEDE